jgi:hypothetical protein
MFTNLYDIDGAEILAVTEHSAEAMQEILTDQIDQPR